MSFSQDGSHLAFATLDWRSTLYRQGFDQVRETTVGPPVAMLKGRRPIRDHDISPDGRWITFNETGAREDLFVARIDGSDYRRLTDDAARDRAPTFSPDGTKILFYSDRVGVYDLWTIRPDGSRMEQITSGANSTNLPIWSSNGARIAYSGINAGGLFVIDSDSKALKPTQPEPLLAPDVLFWPFSWSPDGKRLLGIVLTAEGKGQGLATYDVVSKQYTRVPLKSQGSWMVPDWLNDGRRLLLRTSAGISVVDSLTGRSKSLVSVRGYFIGRSLGVSEDNTWFSYTETGTEGDIWVAVFKNRTVQ